MVLLEDNNMVYDNRETHYKFQNMKVVLDLEMDLVMEMVDLLKLHLDMFVVQRKHYHKFHNYHYLHEYILRLSYNMTSLLMANTVLDNKFHLLCKQYYKIHNALHH